MFSYLYAFKRLLTRLVKIIYNVVLGIFMALFPLIVVSSLFEVMTIPTESMSTPTQMSVNDSCLISKMAYGFNVFSLYLRILTPNLIHKLWLSTDSSTKKVYLPFNKIKRGSVIGLIKPRHPQVNWAKRVVALPGDEFQVKNGIIHINNIPAKFEYVEDYDYYNIEEKRYYKTKIYKEQILDGPEHIVMHLHDLGTHLYDNTPLIKVPEGFVMVMGDNRNRSNDSRGGIWFIHMSCIVGCPVCQLVSSEHVKGVVKYLNPNSILTLQIFHPLNIIELVRHLILIPFSMDFSRSLRIIK